MKTSLALLLFISIGLAPTHAQVWQGADDQLREAGSSIVTVIAEFELDLGQMAQMMGMDDSTITIEQTATGALVNSRGVVLIPLDTLVSPSLPRMGPSGGSDALRTKITVRVGKRQVYSAKVIVENKKLGVALLQISDPKGAHFKSVNLDTDATAKIGEQLLCVGRLTEPFGFALKASSIHIAGAISKPVPALLQQGCEINGSCVYNAKRQFIGFAVMTPKAEVKDAGPFDSLRNGGAMTQVIVVLPARSVRDSFPRVRTTKPATVKIDTQVSIDPAFSSADKDSNGNIDRGEFVAYAKQRLSNEDDDFFARFFRLVDGNKNGRLSAKEFGQRMKALGGARRGEGKEAAKTEKPKRRRRPTPTERDLNDLESDYDANSRRAAPRDAFPVFDNPKMSTAKEAKTAADEVVIGVVCDGEARAYPISIMGVHELGNDVCGKTPIAVSW